MSNLQIKINKDAISMPKLNRDSLKSLFSFSPISFKTIWSLTKKILWDFFNNPAGYAIMIALSLFHLGLFFFLAKFFIINRAEFNPFFEFLPFVLMFGMPAITMGMVTNEKIHGTLELLLTKPVSTLELVLSKVLGSSLYILIVLAVESLLLLIISKFGVFDYGKLFSQYFAGTLLILALASFGVFISSFVKNQINAFLVSFLGILLLIMLGWEPIAVLFPIKFSAILDKVSLLTQYNSMLDGAIDLRNILYFVGFIILFIALANYKILSLRFPRNHSNLRSLRISTTLIALLLILATGYGQRIPGRVDLTRGKVNSLTKASKSLVANLGKDAQVIVYYSQNLPVSFQGIKSDLFRLARDYDHYGNDKLSVVFKSTDLPELRQEAEQAGIQPLTFQEQDYDRFGISQGFLGVVIKSGDKTETIPSVVNTDNLEYEISSILRNQTNENKKKIAVANTGVKLATFGSTGNPFESMEQFYTSLNRDYQVENIDITSKSLKIDNASVNALILAGPNATLPDEAKAEIRRYFNDGGAIFLLSDPIDVNMQFGLTASVNPNSMNTFFEDIGVKVEPSLLYDLSSHEAINMRGYILPIRYPLFPIIPVVKGDSALSGIDSVTFGWGGWISLAPDKYGSDVISQLLQTTKFAGFQKEDALNVTIEQDWSTISEASLDSFVTGVSILEKDDKPGRAIVVADAGMIDDFGAQTGQNLAFGLSAVEWLTQDTALAEIKAKQRIAPALQINPLTQLAIQYGGIISLPILIAAVGGVRLWKRRR